LSYLIFDDVAINAVSLTDNVARFFCFDNTFVVGQVLTVSGCGAPFDGSRTVTEKNVDEYGVTYFEAAVTNADITKRRVIPNGRAVLTSQAALYDTTPEVREAAWRLQRHLDHTHWHTRPARCGFSKSCTVPLRPFYADPRVRTTWQAPRH
jgi:hypothetical protein